jgi:dimethylargininase
MSLTAVTRPPTASLARCELTFLERAPIDVARAWAQHRAFEALLRRLGAEVVSLPPADELPDATFVEDGAVVLDEVAVVCRPGVPSRQAETDALAEVLGRYRPLARIEAPGTLDGGDVLRVGRRLFVGLSTRSNAEGVAQLRRLAAPLGYDVAAVPVAGSLHLKTACTAPADDVVLLNPAWVDPAAVGGVRVMRVPPEEPWGANVLTVAGTRVVPASHPRTRALVESLGVPVCTADIAELQKAEAGITCLCVLIADPQ